MAAVRLRVEHACPGSGARLGTLETPHGVVETPCFVVTRTANGEQGVLPAEVQALGARMALATTYHLLLRPGPEAVRALGGLHAFLPWEGPLITDSGSLQAFGLRHSSTDLSPVAGWPDVAPARPHELRGRGRGQQPRLVRVDDTGVTCTSHFDGSLVRITPESTLLAQEALGADCVVAFHAPLPAGGGERATAKAMGRTQRWARQCLSTRTRADQALYGVAQGGQTEELWQASGRDLAALPFEGVVLGPGSGAGWRAALAALPEAWPRHVSGAGSPEELFRCVSAGADTIDGYAPARLAHRGVLFTRVGLLDITEDASRDDERVVDDRCTCYTCHTGFSRAYLHHLVQAGELLGATLASLHNLRFLLHLMEQIRAALRADALEELRQDVLARYQGEMTRSATCG